MIPVENAGPLLQINTLKYWSEIPQKSSDLWRRLISIPTILRKYDCHDILTSVLQKLDNGWERLFHITFTVNVRQDFQLYRIYAYWTMSSKNSYVCNKMNLLEVSYVVL